MNEINREIRAVEIHQKAQSYYQISEEFGYKFLMELQIIKKEDLYLDLGFQTFGEYTENNFGYSQRTIEQRIQTAMFGRKK